MHQLSQADMMEATRLTREGRLEEAMALLQGTRRPEAPSASYRDSAPSPTAKASPQGAAPQIDMVPPSTSGGAWTAPSMKGTAFAGGTGASPSPEMPAVLRGLMDRMGGLGAMEGSGAGLSEALKGKLGGAFGGAVVEFSVGFEVVPEVEQGVAPVEVSPIRAVGDFGVGGGEGEGAVGGVVGGEAGGGHREAAEEGGFDV